MKIKKHILSLFALMPLMFGCENFLNINPKSEVINDDMFSSAEVCEDALYGIYSDLGYKPELFSKTLSHALPEVMSSNFSHSNYELSYINIRDYDRADSRRLISDTWENLYAQVGNVNNILYNLQDRPDNEFRYMRLYKGEAYALRGFLHFTIAQYFAPPFASTDNAAKMETIPYVDKYDYHSSPLSSLEYVFKRIISDLTTAEGYLTDDLTLVSSIRNNHSTDGFTSCRMIHLNLHAVQALLARVYWYMGDLTNAEIYALKVINSKKFPLNTTADFLQFEGATISMKETIFGLYSTQLYGKYYSEHIEKTNYQLREGYEDLYADSGPAAGADIRLTTWFSLGDDKCFKHFNKLSESTNSTYSGPSILGFSVIRIPEMYYIVAEANLTKDPAKAMQYFDYVIESRGMVKFANRENVSAITGDDIYLERNKEYFAEGLRFLDMKRQQKSVKPSLATLLDGTLVSTYTFPLPKSETNPR